MSRSILLPLATTLSIFALVAAPVGAQQRTLTEEQKAKLQERLKAADANGDGRLSPDEMRAMATQLAERRRPR